MTQFKSLIALAGIAAFISGCDSDSTDGNNQPPVATSAVFNVDTDGSLPNGSLSGSDADGDDITFTITTQPQNGSVTINDPATCGDNNVCSFSYTPDPGFEGQDQFNFQASDGTSNSSPATIFLLVTPAAPNNAPQIQDQSFDTQEDTAISAQIIASDPDNDTITYALEINTGPNNGDVTVNNDGTFTYTPERDFIGTDNFDVTVTDSNNDSTTATITIVVSCTTTNPSGVCDWDKLPSAGSGTEPAIAIDTAQRPSVAYVDDNTANGGTNRDLFVSQFQNGVFGRLLGPGTNGAVSDGVNPANRPDIVAALVLPTTLAVSWEANDDIFVSARNQITASWADVSGRPNTTAAADPALAVDAVTGSPVLTWTDTSDPANGDILLASNTSPTLALPGNWQQLNSPLDILVADDANRVTIAVDDVAGGGVNVAGRLTIGWQETIAGVDTIYVKQCPNADDGNPANCIRLGNSVNVDPAIDAEEVSIAVPNLAAAVLIGDSPLNPRPVAAFSEGGNLYVRRYNPNTNAWDSLLDGNTAGGELNVNAGSTASNPAIVADLLGRYTVVWEETGASGVSQIFVKRFDATGDGTWTPLGGVLNCDATSNARNPDIAFNLLGLPYITFEEDTPSGTEIVVMQFGN